MIIKIITETEPAYYLVKTEWKIDDIIEKIKEKTALYKLCLDNFDSDLKFEVEDADGNAVEVSVPNLVMDCLSSQIISLTQNKSEELTSNPMDLIREIQAKGFDDKDTAFEVYNLLMEKYNNIPANESRRLIYINDFYANI